MSSGEVPREQFLTVGGRMWSAECCECKLLFPRDQLHSGFKFGDPALICTPCRDELIQRFAAYSTFTPKDNTPND